jgi:hypothetical protein
MYSMRVVLDYFTGNIADKEHKDKLHIKYAIHIFVYKIIYTACFICLFHW